MIAFLAKRLATAVGLLLAITVVTFALLYVGGGSVARTILGDTATPEQILAKEVELGLDRPLISRYVDWLGSALTGDFGTSWTTYEPVLSGILTRLPVTLSVCIAVLALTAVLATILGTAAAVWRGWLDRVMQVLTIGGFAVPSFIFALFLVAVFAIQNRWFPATGYARFSDDPRLWAISIALPVLSLLLGSVAAAAQQIRSAVIEVRRRDFVRTLRSRGLGEGEILLRHVLRNAAPAALTVLSLQFVHLLGGSFVIESVFALPGIGLLAVQATSAGNLPMIMGIVTYVGAMVIVVNTLADIANGWLNPRARMG